MKSSITKLKKLVYLAYFDFFNEIIQKLKEDKYEVVPDTSYKLIEGRKSGELNPLSFIKEDSFDPAYGRFRRVCVKYKEHEIFISYQANHFRAEVFLYKKVTTRKMDRIRKYYYAQKVDYMPYQKASVSTYDEDISVLMRKVTTKIDKNGKLKGLYEAELVCGKTPVPY